MAAAEKQRLSAREAAYLALLRVEKDGAYANLALAKLLDTHQVSPADSRLATEVVYGASRMRLALDYLLASLLARPLTELKKEALVILRLSLYQLYYLDKVEPYAVVDEAVKLAKKYAGLPLSGLVNAVLRNYLRRKRETLLPGPDKPRSYLHITLSYPRWIADYLLARFGAEQAVRFARLGNEHQGLYLRANTLVMSRDELSEALKAEGVMAAAAGFAPETLRVEKGSGRLAASPLFRQGAFIMQGAASQLAAHALAPAPGSRALDLCAAPGGKSTHLAALMDNQGEVRACDVHQHKIRLIEDNARRLGAGIIRAELADGATLPPEYREWADYLLLDAPCSGLGVLNERPDSRFHKRIGDVAELAELSYRLLEAAAGYLKPGGRLCYSTCTITEQENEENVRRFLAAHPEFALAPIEGLLPLFTGEGDRAALAGGMLQLLPHIHGTEGFFIALLCKQ